MSKLLYFIKKSANNANKVALLTRQKINKLQYKNNKNKTIKKVLKINDLESKNNNEVNEQIRHLINEVQEMSQQIQQIIHINSNHNLDSYLNLIHSYNKHLSKVLISSNKFKYEIIEENIKWIERFIKDVVDKNAKLADPLEEISEKILYRIDIIRGLLLSTIGSIHNEIEMIKRKLEKKKKEKRQINNELHHKIATIDKSWRSIYSTNAQQAYNLKVSSLKNKASMNKNKITKDMIFLQNKLERLQR